MIELPESYVLATQINGSLTGKTIRSVTANAHQHKFATFNGDPAQYEMALTGKRVISASLGMNKNSGSHVEILCADTLLVVSASIRYYTPGEAVAPKHQLMLEFEDASHMCCIVQIWGSVLSIPAADIGDPEKYPGLHMPTPLDDAFNMDYFTELIQQARPILSAKAFLTGERRIPGLGNGVMHDVLYNARIHPKRKIDTFTQIDKDKLFNSIKSTLRYMAERGGRDTEFDLFGNAGGYKTILSIKSSGLPCGVCRKIIQKEMYLGGNIYYCPECQPL
ncbi:MAG: endonuclease VIII [Oscillospiraceae bacterium]|nr:endonuclease VIII [Oscillospiraceae bacterium]